MSEDKQSRKQFFQKAAVVASVAAISGSAQAKVYFENDLKLTDEQKRFLSTYEAWLEEFHSYIKVRNNDFYDMTNNHKLMALSAQADEWKPQLVEFMKDEKFAAYYAAITADITKTIANF